MGAETWSLTAKLCDSCKRALARVASDRWCPSTTPPPTPNPKSHRDFYSYQRCPSTTPPPRPNPTATSTPTGGALLQLRRRRQIPNPTATSTLTGGALPQVRRRRQSHHDFHSDRWCPSKTPLPTPNSHGSAI
nr:hypothetical protein Iba_chr01cCG5460 [Ipomoea batatas]